MRTIPQKLLLHSRNLRKSRNPWEHRLWQQLRAHRFYGLQFKRQVQIGNYIVDFCCRNKKLIIELDGGQHSKSRVKNKDLDKEKFLRSQGYQVLHFWNNEVDENLEGILERVRGSIN